MDPSWETNFLVHDHMCLILAESHKLSWWNKEPHEHAWLVRYIQIYVQVDYIFAYFDCNCSFAFLMLVDGVVWEGLWFIWITFFCHNICPREILMFPDLKDPGGLTSAHDSLQSLYLSAVKRVSFRIFTNCFSQKTHWVWIQLLFPCLLLFCSVW